MVDVSFVAGSAGSSSSSSSNIISSSSPEAAGNPMGVEEPSSSSAPAIDGAEDVELKAVGEDAGTAAATSVATDAGVAIGALPASHTATTGNVEEIGQSSPSRIVANAEQPQAFGGTATATGDVREPATSRIDADAATESTAVAQGTTEARAPAAGAPASRVAEASSPTSIVSGSTSAGGDSRAGTAASGGGAAASSPATGTGEILLKLLIIDSSGAERRTDVRMDRTTTVAELKVQHFAEEVGQGFRLRCVSLGRLLADSDTVGTLPNGSYLQCYLYRGPQAQGTGDAESSPILTFLTASYGTRPTPNSRRCDLVFHTFFAAALAIVWAAYLNDPRPFDIFSRLALRFFSGTWVVVCVTDLVRGCSAAPAAEPPPTTLVM
eukprot:NODE_6976_length_1619_cov_14.077078.p1 GENE.NODE_6976_length_1619_cov_14.077078~~NODE_6976_length_1619_cov_14.077078.p1  ORF type:complete len:381 (-),score=101.14 NODE_6976_length_1619_cov_14.077078:387-1529(-)